MYTVLQGVFLVASLSYKTQVDLHYSLIYHALKVPRLYLLKKSYQAFF
jgi:hypothetical protein